MSNRINKKSYTNVLLWQFCASIRSKKHFIGKALYVHKRYCIGSGSYNNNICTFRFVSIDPEARMSPNRWKSRLHMAALCALMERITVCITKKEQRKNISSQWKREKNTNIIGIPVQIGLLGVIDLHYTTNVNLA